MLEDCTMEKKPSSRSVQAPVKGCGTEVKKAQDATSNAGKQFPRQSRRREPPGSKLDQYKKSGPQKQNKSGYYDNKKPKPRGQFYYGCGKANTQVVDELTEQFGLVATSTNVGSKKQSLNHLLNFHYAPRGEHLMTSSLSPYHWPTNTGGSIGGSGGHYYNSGRWLTSTQKHKYNKEQFLQANCQFVVRSDGDYTAYMSDPDLLVDWDMIEQIRVFSSEAVNCPICLSTPVAGKITRCGHVYCWSCMLHYLALSDKSWRKCPICYESVHRQDLKSVLVLLRTTYTLSDEITFRLMKRKRGSLIASPVAQFDARTLQGLLSINEDKLDVKYSKLLTANNDEVFAIIDKEMAELNEQMAENEGCPELCFIEQAIQLLKERKEALSTRLSVVNDNGKNIDGLNNTTAMSADTAIASHETKQSSSSSSFDSDKDTVGDTVNNNFNATALDNTNENNKPQESDLPTPINWFNKVDADHTNTLDNYISNTGVDSKVDLQLTSPTSPDYEQLESFDIYDEMEAAGIKIDDDIKTEDSGTERCRYVSASSTSEGEDTVGSHITTIVAEDLEISTCEPTNSCSPVKHFFFYQALDGQQIFLHAVNVRMLEMTYGSLEYSPPVIKGKILEKESGSMTDVLRKRLRYLQHLPVTCQFEVAEIDLKPPIITTDTLDSFKEQLETRRRRRDKRARDERRRERKVTEQVHRQYGRGPTPRLRIESLQHFPQCGSDLACSPPSNNPPIGYNNNYVQDGGNQTVQICSSSPTSSRASSPVSVLSSSPNSSSTSLSFAQMLRDGKSTGGGWVTQPRKSQPASSVCASKPLQYDSDDNSLAAPQYRQSFSDAIATAFEKAALMHEKDEPVSSGGKKKKKKQKVLLFATGMACNSK